MKKYSVWGSIISPDIDGQEIESFDTRHEADTACEKLNNDPNNHPDLSYWVDPPIITRSFIVQVYPAIRDSDREKFRTDFNDQFLSDFAMQTPQWGHDPYNHIGYNCGIMPSRALEQHHERWLGSVMA